MNSIISDELFEKIMVEAANASLDNHISLSAGIEKLYISICVLLIIRLAVDMDEDAKKLMEGCCDNFVNNMKKNILVNCKINGIPFGDLDFDINERTKEAILKDIANES